MIGGRLSLQIVTPERPLVQEEEGVEEVNAPGVGGDFGVLPGHTPMLVALRVGEAFYRLGGRKRYLALGGGYAEVGPDRVTILSQTAERAEEIDRQRAASARARAEKRLASPGEGVDVERARAALMRALVRLQAASRMDG